MPKETGTIDLKAQKAARDDAAKYATDYITEISGDGIWVTPEDAKPVDGQAASTTTGWHISDALELFKLGVRYIKAWLNGTVPTVRLGQDASGHADVTPSGMEVFTDASTSVASLGSTTRLGKAGESHQELDYRSMKMVDKEGNTYFLVQDLRDTAGKATVTRLAVGDGSTKSFQVLPEQYGDMAVVSVQGVKVNGDAASYTYSASTGKVTMSTAPGNGKEVAITFVAQGSDLKAYRLGPRMYAEKVYGPLSVTEGTGAAFGHSAHSESAGMARGDFSHAEGFQASARGFGSHAEGSWISEARGDYSHSEGDAIASGYASHAEGGGEGDSTTTTMAGGSFSHAEGFNTGASGFASHTSGSGTWAAGNSQTAIGKYNEYDDSTYAFIVGNGDDEYSRSNAMAVEWDGDVRIAGNVKDMSGNAKFLPLSGGTLTATTTIKSAAINRDTANPSEAQYSSMFKLADADGDTLAVLRARRDTDGGIRAYIGAYNGDSNDTDVSNIITLKVLRDGTCSYMVTNPAAFRSAISAASSSHVHAASAITNLGDYLNFDLGTTSVATATWKELRVNTSTARVKLPAGCWVVMVSVSFATNATGRRMVLLTTDSSAASSSINRTTVASFSIPAATGEQTKNTVTTVVYPSAETTYYVHAYQNSGSAVNTGAYVRAVRIR